MVKDKFTIKTPEQLRSQNTDTYILWWLELFNTKEKKLMELHSSS